MRFIIHGGEPLEGEIRLSGAKNAATKMMIASLLTEEPVTLTNFPRIGDTDITAELCEHIGSAVDAFGSTLTIRTKEVRNTRVLQLSRRNRLPILALGPLLARVGEAEVPILGGDKIGPRPVNLHIKALEALGAEVEVLKTSYRARTKQGLRGAAIAFDFPSVGATENAILAAVLAAGKTTLTNAATEPEVIDLIKMLQNMGAVIELGADRTVYIEGVPRLHGVSHAVLPDRNEAVSFACLAIATAGRILVKDAIQDHLITFLNVVRRMGADYKVVPEGIIFWRANALRSLDIATSTHPGFMTDWQQPLAVLLTQAKGASTIHETIYEDRFGYAKDLHSLGAQIEVSSECPKGSPCRLSGKGALHFASLRGPTPLLGAPLTVRDLRSGIAHVIAALVAKGESEIQGVEELDRGYERIDERLRNLGAEIERLGQ
jgi:UDP-N-acetylglucosamine 1-carboxyvinyltransferase